jgi:hypothetical protein
MPQCFVRKVTPVTGVSRLRVAYATQCKLQTNVYKMGVALSRACLTTRYFSQPRFLKYHMGTSALAAIKPRA